MAYLFGCLINGQGCIRCIPKQNFRLKITAFGGRNNEIWMEDIILIWPWRTRQGWGEYTNPEYEYEYEYFA